MAKESEDNRKTYATTLHDSQVELVKFQKHVIENDQKVLVILEGRDAAGKDGAAKRIAVHLSPRETPNSRARDPFAAGPEIVELPALVQIT